MRKFEIVLRSWETCVYNQTKKQVMALQKNHMTLVVKMNEHIKKGRLTEVEDEHERINGMAMMF